MEPFELNVCLLLLFIDFICDECAGRSQELADRTDISYRRYNFKDIALLTVMLVMLSRST